MSDAYGQAEPAAPRPADTGADGQGPEVRAPEVWVGSQPKTSREREVETALVAEDWLRVDRVIGEARAETQAIERLIKAHACLALNRNNDSVLLFLSVKDDELKTWHVWTSRFAEEHPTDAIGQYLLGDSLARIGDYERAVASFEAGLRQHPEHPLLLNAQGVAYAARAALPEARRCFDGAIAASKANLADAHANLGMYWIQRSDGAEGAIASFTRAAEISPGFGFAIHGRACAKLMLHSPDVGDDLALMYVGAESVDALVDGNLKRYAESVAMADKDLSAALVALRDGGTTLAKQWTADPLVLKADFHLRAAHEIGSNTTVWGPIRQFLVWRHENDAAKNIKAASERDGGWGVVGAYRKQVEPELGRVLDTVVRERIGRDNARGAQITGGVSTAAQAGKLLAEGYGLRNPLVARQTAAARLGMDVVKFAADTMNRQQRSYSAFADGYRAHVGATTTPTLTPFRSASPSSQDRGAGPGGADLSLAKIHWDRGGWPFVPLYGLSYGLRASPESAAGEPRETPVK